MPPPVNFFLQGMKARKERNKFIRGGKNGNKSWRISFQESNTISFI